jgi:hypothetical protein
MNRWCWISRWIRAKTFDFHKAKKLRTSNAQHPTLNPEQAIHRTHSVRRAVLCTPLNIFRKERARSNAPYHCYSTRYA